MRAAEREALRARRGAEVAQARNRHRHHRSHGVFFFSPGESFCFSLSLRASVLRPRQTAADVNHDLEEARGGLNTNEGDDESKKKNKMVEN